ncbi:MAG: HAD family hydrolase [Bacillota bacterium]
MSYRLLALDIDGTLTNSRGELTERTIQAVKLAASRGALVCLVSGRRPRGMRGIASALALNGL